LKLINVARAIDRKLEVAWLMMPHGTSSMLMVKNPTKCFGGIISHVKGSRDMLHQNVALLTPFLDCKELNVNVS